MTQENISFRIRWGCRKESSKKLTPKSITVGLSLLEMILSTQTSPLDHYGEAVPTRAYDEEHFTANIEVDPSGTFYGWVFKFMGGIQIIAPQECVEEMKRIARRFL